MPTRIIYIPGIGDQYDGFRRFMLRFWQLWGVSTEYVSISWYDGGSFEEKMKRIASAIESADSKRVVLIGESAGATLALHTSLGYKNIHRVITLCGVAQPGTPVSGHLRRRAPALDEAVNTLPENFSVSVHSVRALYDGTVGKKWSKTNGATIHTIWMIGHRMTIVACLTVLAPLMVSIAKK